MFGFSQSSGAAAAARADVGRPAHLVPWIEKYRPKTMDDVAHQEEVVRALKSAIHSANMPHLLFYGPPGTGKTSSIHAIAHQLYGPIYKSRVLELNASDERGIGMIRERVKKFAQVQVRYHPTEAKEYPCPPYKIIILDEADQLTSEAQAALRRTMENYTRVTRFCLICNYISRIIEPLGSRCAKFRFQPIGDDSHRKRLEHIAAAEGVKIGEAGMTTLLLLAEGDLRRSITLMQSAYNLHGPDHHIAPSDLLEVAGCVKPAVITAFLHTCKTASSFDDVQKVIEQDLVAGGYTCSQIIPQITARLVGKKVSEGNDMTDDQDQGSGGGMQLSTELTDLQKAKIATRCGEVDSQLMDGADEYLQLLKLGADLMNILKQGGNNTRPHHN
ncbi:unnamed protein product [Vitrella brassicaformis CCMP3155]|uniref:AAA+ ATPase domain-containing protein n=2 Tax=Vitrella brassicaformis TaxID=1169539 RepID=A0A0G4ESG8_VITBC|nr:unnamed protein product [Vitrella brassicaformis CCMP3155]|mmetsp:Transcript_25681/g.74091  ORF Transcript_25681/g.74091 Transcript_25681/m.74091 type:complete len:387 (+) Transcript_25681:78-1238(+)|eukprot:CEM00862.1 unnamed protein product [Vitrella brassicaformis CCMP3155]